ncbi:MAG: protein kinase, partial [Gammaproteobacteria bacterium]|nr:protein kinase [Gammaproteobacteria bacterium]
QESSGDPSASPTITSLGTVAGVILGTAAYMSPEQARGQVADRRADVWSFGALLYEMLSGVRPFEGDTISDTLAAVLRAEPDWDRIRADTPRRVRRLTQRCLLKDPRRRLQAIGEARVQLEDEIAHPGEDETETVAAAAPSSAGRLGWIVAAVALAGCVALFALWRTSGSEPPIRIRSEIVLDPPVGDLASSSMRLLPDGHRVVYVGNKNNDLKLWLRDFSQLEARVLPGTESAYPGTFSPGGDMLAFFADDELKKISISGGAAVSLVPISANPRGASWSEDGYIYYSPGTFHPIMRVLETGGEPEEVTSFPEKQARINSHRWPTILPGGKGLMYLAGLAGDFADAQIEVLDLDSKETRVLHVGALYPQYLSSGHITFVSNGQLVAMGFDPVGLQVTSPPKAAVWGVQHAFGNGGAQYSVSDNGTLIYLPGEGSQLDHRMKWIEPDGTSKEILGSEVMFHPRFSPDGRRLAYTIGLGTVSDIWVWDVERDVHTRLTLDTEADSSAAWSSDGEWMAFSSSRHNGPANIYRKRADGSGDVERLTESENRQYPSAWSSDDSMLLFIEAAPDRGFDVRLLRFDENGRPTGEPEDVVATTSGDVHSMFSADDRFILYESEESGGEEIYLRTIDGSGRWQVSDGGGRTPRWSGDGKQIFYHLADPTDPEIRVVDFSLVNGTPSLSRSRTHVKAPLALVQTVSAAFDVHPADGRIVAFVMPELASQAANPILVQGWFDELDK